MPKLVLLRHGESAWNKENRFTGWVDVGLTETGEREARRRSGVATDGCSSASAGTTEGTERASGVEMHVTDQPGYDRCDRLDGDIPMLADPRPDLHHPNW